jgi:threonine/homoserine/homoserine lactone efflux protein
VGLNSLVDVVVVLATARLLRSAAVRQARGRMLTRVSGATMLGIGTWLAFAGRSE